MPPQPSPGNKEGLEPVHILRATERGLSAHEDVLAREEPLEIQIGYSRVGVRASRSVSVTMRTPGDDASLACGFLLGEGIVRERAQVSAVTVVAPNVIRVELADGVEVDLSVLERHFYTSSSCGVCGKTSIEAVRASVRFPLPGEGPFVDVGLLAALPDRLREGQSVFERTGALHGAGLFGTDGSSVVLAEDVGRHNAVDKVIGSRFLAGANPIRDGVLVVSGRASFELVQKALMAGIAVFVAVGGPSSLAVELARRHGITLLGFARGGRANVYSGAHRLRGVPAAAGS